MNNMTVGMENLPNVFIDKIDLYPILQPSTGFIFRYRIEVKLCMYDHSPKRSWYRREDLSDLSIKIVFRGGEAAAALNDGSDSLYDYNTNFPAVIVVGQTAFSIEDEMQDYTKLSTSVEITIPTQNSLNVYAACYIDGLNFGNDLFNKFYGPMAAEKIFSGGAINKQSGYFYYPDTNEEYGGPVHQHTSAGYMEGSEHSEESHASLAYVAEEDYKIRFPIEADAGFFATTPPLNFAVDPVLRDETAEAPDTLDVPIDTSNDLDPVYGVLTEADMAQLTDILNQRPQAQNLLADVSFEVRDAIRRGIY